MSFEFKLIFNQSDLSSNQRAPISVPFDEICNWWRDDKRRSFRCIKSTLCLLCNWSRTTGKTSLNLDGRKIALSRCMFGIKSFDVQPSKMKSSKKNSNNYLIITNNLLGNESGRRRRSPLLWRFTLSRIFGQVWKEFHQSRCKRKSIHLWIIR